MTCKRPSRKAVATSACVVQSVLILHLLAHSKHYGDDITWVATIQGRTSYAFSSSIAFSAFVSVTTPTIAAAAAAHSVWLY